MCLAVIAVGASPDIPLLIMSNRDEFYERPSQSAHWWDDRPDFFAGRDSRAGGTWFGFSRNGRYSLVTNYREAIVVGKFLSRGQLVSEFLDSDETPTQYATRQQHECKQYRGFSLITGRVDADTVYCSNRAQPFSQTLAPGVYGLSNELLNTPWPKVLRVKAAVEQWLENESGNIKLLFDAFRDRQIDQQPAQNTEHLPAEIRRALTAPFIAGDTYGTRATTLATVNTAGEVEIIERRFEAGGVDAGETRERFSIARAH